MIAVITPTHDRPQAMALCARWLESQTCKPDLWVVADDGKEKWGGASIDGIEIAHSTAPSKGEGYLSLISNVKRALPIVARASVVVMFEDDDAYRPTHIETQLAHLQNHAVVGCRWLNYYNLKLRAWRTMHNSCSALSNTAFRGFHTSVMRDACDEAERSQHYGVDRLFWKRMGATGLHNDVTVIGMKGLPGTFGIGVGHKDSTAWVKDPEGKKLREWLGAAADVYEPLMPERVT